MLPYWIVLIGASLAFAAAERLRPWRQQRLVRRGVFTDLAYLGFNGHVLALLLAPAVTILAPAAESLIAPWLGKAHLASLPLWSQFLLAFFTVDLLQWGIHNLMHRVPALWAIHRVHHSITEMDWIGSMRFHWLEIVVYRSLQYVPMLLFGFDWRVLAWLAAFSTVMGHFNHSNLRPSLGPLRYLLNDPTMHIWHHDAQRHGNHGCNFGINLSLWDWLFGTAYLPRDRVQPAALGFPGIEDFPDNFVTQQTWPHRAAKPGAVATRLQSPGRV
jgi:sterol desaturase/sphingolipid hydroxylase (fatty acid hydroxylase superfamily)